MYLNEGEEGTAHTHTKELEDSWKGALGGSAPWTLWRILATFRLEPWGMQRM